MRRALRHIFYVCAALLLVLAAAYAAPLPGASAAQGAFEGCDIEGLSAKVATAAADQFGTAEQLDVDDLESFEVPFAVKEQACDYIYNQNPKLFYITGLFCRKGDDNERIARVYADFDIMYNSDDIDVLDEAIEFIAGKTGANWCAEQKALFAHEKLVAACVPDMTETGHSAYSALVECCAASKGYALAYKCLLDRLSVPCEVVDVAGSDYAFNTVVVDGKCYFVDCYADDTVPKAHVADFGAYCGHAALLCGKQKLRAAGAPGSSWLDSWGVEVCTDDACSDDRDSSDWNGVPFEIAFAGDTCAYVDAQNGIDVHVHACSEDGCSAKTVRVDESMWDEASWGVSRGYSRLFADGDTFVLTGPGGLYRVQPEALAASSVLETEKIAALPAWMLGAGYVFGADYDASSRVVTYRIKNAPGGPTTGTGAFKLAQDAFDLASARITLSKTTCVYSGTARKPAVCVKLGAGSVPAGYGYTVTYGNNVKVGMATAQVKGTGGIAGTRKLSFIIKPKGTKIKKLAKGKRAFTVRWAKQPKQTGGYQVRYSLKKNMKGSKFKKLAKPKAVKLTVKKLKSKKTYYVQVRTFKKAGGSTYYSAWSAKKSIKVK